MDAKAGDWVKIHDIVLDIGERATNLPQDTKNVPLEMWVKGFLLNDNAKIGDMVEIQTYIGRKINGCLVEVDPYYNHDYGKSIPEILYIGRQARDILEKVGGTHE